MAAILFRNLYVLSAVSMTDMDSSAANLHVIPAKTGI